MNFDWYAARTKTGAEGRAEWHLRNQGYPTYLPRYRKSIRHARKTTQELRPLFPGYIFVGIDQDLMRWRPVNSTAGVINLVQFGTEPHPVAPEIIDMIRAQEDEDGIVKLLNDNLRCGDVVTFRDGHFADCTALLEKISDNHRVVLLMSLMGQEVRIKTTVEMLEKAS
ncbi:MAG: transcriptional activator RfaH [Rhodospirillales bacterium]